MPQYEYFCHSCQKAFSKTLTLQEYEEGEITCPDCGSKEVERNTNRVLRCRLEEELMLAEIALARPSALGLSCVPLRRTP